MEDRKMSHPRFVRVRAFVYAAVAVGLLLPLASGRKAAAAPKHPYRAGEVLVRFKRDVGESDKNHAIGRAHGRVIKRLRTESDDELGDPGVHRIQTDLSVEDAIDALSQDPNVEYAEPNWFVTHSDVADDTSYVGGNQWDMYGDDNPPAGPSGTTNVYGCDAENAWAQGVTGSSDVCVGVIDEGMQLTHPELAANVWTNPFEIPGNGIDDDGNGYVDDVHGWDFYHDDATVYDAADGDDHGTHVSGTIGAKGGNGAGIAGVNWNVTLIPAKFLGPNGGYISDAVDALNYLRDLKVRHGLRIVCASNSWGGGGYSSTMHTAILRAAKEGILFVAAAGNSGSNNDATPFYPAGYSTLVASSTESAASYEAVISVAAIDANGNRPSWSSYGATTVDLGAPGVGVLSTVPTDSYAYYSGTSMATPHVSGALALYASAFPSATAAQIRAAILGNTTPTPSLAGITVTGGRLNLGGGLFSSAPPPPPPPPTQTHDVAVTSVTMPATVKRGKTVNASIAVANQGTFTETFKVSLTATGGTHGGAKTVKLSPGAATSVTISWRAPNAVGTYTITASASAVPGETDLADNSASTTTTVVQ